MPARGLPAGINLDDVARHAGALRDLVRAGDREAVALVAAMHPSPDVLATGPAGFSRSDAELVIARRHGFADWDALRRHLEVLAADPPGGRPPDLADLTDAFLRLACLTYGGDDLANFAKARALLAAEPRIATVNIYAMAAVGEAGAAAALLAADPGQARRAGGPHGWEPLLYAAFSRVDSTAPGHSTLEVARLLLAHGADPDAGFLWEGLDSPFTALTGAFGEGEDAVNQPRHRDGPALARLLLDAGADPNDGQALYNRHFAPADDHLELLLAYGLGTGSGGPWRERLGDAHATPAQMVADQLRWAATNGMPDRVRLLLDHGVDPDAPGSHPGFDGRTAWELATLAGNPDIADMLHAAGARPVALDPVHSVTAACMRVDRAAVDRLVTADPTLPARAVAADPGLIARAAARGRPDAVRLMAEVGFDVNAVRRVTALHEVAYRGDLAMVRLLVELGADPTIRDTEFGSTPAGWARHNHHPEVADFLDGLA